MVLLYFASGNTGRVSMQHSVLLITHGSITINFKDQTIYSYIYLFLHSGLLFPAYSIFTTYILLKYILFFCLVTVYMKHTVTHIHNNYSPVPRYHKCHMLRHQPGPRMRRFAEHLSHSSSSLPKHVEFTIKRIRQVFLTLSQPLCQTNLQH